MARWIPFLLCATVAAEANAECIDSAEAAGLIAALFPTAKVDSWTPSYKGAKPCRMVGPVQRNGKWGWVDTAHVLPFPEGNKLIAFRLNVAMDSQADAPKLRAWNPMEQGNLDALEGMQVILVNSAGKFVAKPEGYPLLASRDIGCMGDLCSTQGVILSGLKAIDGNPGAALIDFDHDGYHKLLVLLWRDGKLLARELKRGLVDDLTGCDRYTSVGGVRATAKHVTVQLTDHCNAENCPEECKGGDDNRLIVLFRKK